MAIPDRLTSSPSGQFLLPLYYSSSPSSLRADAPQATEAYEEEKNIGVTFQTTILSVYANTHRK